LGVEVVHEHGQNQRIQESESVESAQEGTFNKSRVLCKQTLFHSLSESIETALAECNIHQDHVHEWERDERSRSSAIVGRSAIHRGCQVALNNT
jgi:hypothetical protein